MELLLIDADEVDQESFHRSLHQLAPSLQITIAVTAADALRRLRAQAATGRGLPDAIVLELYLPGMSGFEFLQALRQDAVLQGLRVLVFAGSAEEQTRLQAYNVAGYLKKDFLADTWQQLLKLLATT